MIDIHTHIIPRIDDGAEDLKCTIQMLKNASSEGIEGIVATPHYCIGYGEERYPRIKAKVRMLNMLAERRKINIKIYHGQEVYYTDRIINDYIQNNIGTINDSRYMLIEFDLYKFPKGVFSVLYDLQCYGVIPVIAHPERYKYIIENIRFINEFIDEGYLFQLNTGSIDGRFGYKIKKTAKRLVNNHIYSFIGSDAHDSQYRRIQVSKSMEYIRKYDNKYAMQLGENNIKLIKNDTIRFIGQKIKKTKWF